ncbi:unnamed protein product [Urochloa humidicola]
MGPCWLQQQGGRLRCGGALQSCIHPLCVQAAVSPRFVPSDCLEVRRRPPFHSSAPHPAPVNFHSAAPLQVCHGSEQQVLLCFI